MPAADNGDKAADAREKPDKGKLYTKGQILSSLRYRARRDVLGALLEDGREYTLEETDRMLKEFMERKVH
jgi:hypothetical protein